MGNVFRFKQFEVDQSGCAMKINTDGVLLAAICTANNPFNILDIGTGTGVIALMLAQRFPKAMVNAVEIDEQAAVRASANFANSPFDGRLQAFCEDINSFESPKKYQLVVSNPPYFVNDLKNPEIRKGLARHADEDFFETLVRKVAALLDPEGQFWVILPVKQAEELMVKAVLSRLFPLQVIHVHSDESKAEFRQIVCFGFSRQETVHQNFYIYAAKDVYTAAYKHLLKEFFLAF